MLISDGGWANSSEINTRGPSIRDTRVYFLVIGSVEY